MRPSLKKIKIIIKSNSIYFSVTAVVVWLLYGLLYALVSHVFGKADWIKEISSFKLSGEALLLLISFFFFVPVAMLLLSKVSKSITGIGNKELDPIQAKKFLAMSIGVFWASLAIILIGFINGPGYLLAAALFFLIVSWYQINRILQTYALL